MPKPQTFFGLSEQTYRAVNAVEPAHLQDEASPLRDIDAILDAILDNPDRFRANKLVKEEHPEGTLSEVKTDLVDRMMNAVEYHPQGKEIINNFVARTFDVLCAGFHLTDADLPSIEALYLYLGIMCVPYGGVAQYHPMHYEHPDLSKGRETRVYNSSFVIATAPFGTDCLHPSAYTFEQHLQGGHVKNRRNLLRTPSAAWNRISGFVPHGAPEMPETYEDALIAAHESEYPELALKAVTEEGIWRIVGHGGLRLNDLYVSKGHRSNLITGAGKLVAPETLAIIAPEYRRS